MSCHVKPEISLLQVREVFSQSLFFYRPDSVSIMDGADEGTLLITPLPSVRFQIVIKYSTTFKHFVAYHILKVLRTFPVSWVSLFCTYSLHVISTSHACRTLT